MEGKRVFELMLEIGHKSSPLNKKLTNGYTHKWTAFVRGVENSKIEHCIHRVVFHLHESFENSERVVSEPPYQIKETGYAGFEIPIQIYFKNKERPNHLTFVHDLCLLTAKSNDASTIERIKFINPNREFEKCLIKSGAQLLSGSVKKERSDSPPAKKQKSSSIIPSKDMNKRPQQPPAPTQTQPQQNNHQPKVQTSKDFVNFFGAPLMYNKGQTKEQARETAKEDLPDPVQTQPNQTKAKESIHKEDQLDLQPPIRAKARDSNKEEQLDLQLIQSKISCLSDCNRLQKIVDIVEEAGEWYNLTSKKFEFDLKRLDRKTLSKIEKCLH